MAAERITAEAVSAEVVAFDARERAIVAGQVVLDFSHAGVLATLFPPREWEAVAAYLFALIERAPLAASPAYLAHKTILGAIAADLRTYARIAGEPVGLEADLRAASSQAEEQRIRARMADQAAARDRQLTEIELEQAAYHAHVRPDPAEEEPTSDRVAAPPQEIVDVDAWT